jgi:hypothetical protein
MNPTDKYKLYRNIFISLFLCTILIFGQTVKWSDWTSVTTLESSDLIPMVENDSSDNRTVTATNFFRWETGNWNLANTHDQSTLNLQITDTTLQTWLSLRPAADYVSIQSDSVQLTFGAADDFRIFHDGVDSIIRNFTGDTCYDSNADGKNHIFTAEDDGAVDRTPLVLDPDTQTADFLAYTAASKTISADSDAETVLGYETVYVNTTSANVTLGGLANGKIGQTVHIIKTIQANDLIIEHNEGTGTQKFWTNDGNDITLSNWGGVTFKWSGSFWFEVGY